MGNGGKGIAAVTAGAEHQVRRTPISPVIWPRSPRCRFRAHSRPFGADARVFGSRNNVLPRVLRKSVRTKSHPASRLLLSCLECTLGRQCRRSISAAIISPAARCTRSQFLLLGCCSRLLSCGVRCDAGLCSWGRLLGRLFRSFLRRASS